jgi:hypothetical protein
MIAAVCEHFHIGPAQVGEATLEEFDALLRQRNETIQRANSGG